MFLQLASGEDDIYAGIMRIKRKTDQTARLLEGIVKESKGILATHSLIHAHCKSENSMGVLQAFWRRWKVISIASRLFL